MLSLAQKARFVNSNYIYLRSAGTPSPSITQAERSEAPLTEEAPPLSEARGPVGGRVESVSQFRRHASFTSSQFAQDQGQI